MPDTFTITLIFIILAAAVAAFVRRVTRDKCLKDFASNMVTLEQATGKIIWGTLNVENTGLEFVYPQTHKDKNGHDETSFVLYKHEYPTVTALIRYHDQLTPAKRKARQKQLKLTYHPGPLHRLKRKTLNLFKTVRDSVIEVVNMLISQAKKATPAGALLNSEQKHVTAMKQELVSAVGTAFEPLLEKYIGRKVVLELIRGDKIIEYCGVLKDYTADFIEIMDVDFIAKETQSPRKADLVVPRKCGVVRHLSE